ncbi:MAG: Gfo/Idh/MocA family oxidoreductase, partial [Erysipelotrichaceae bacterium]|nr:Gfo/Idh/MocA family oxidoreductase [Erysipelotrichaceae bacterium]
MKVGVLGTGNISTEFMEASKVAEVPVRAIYHRELQKAQNFADKWGIGKAYDDIDSFLADEDFDTVYIGLPNGLHYEYGKKALLAHKHVLMEKPFCSNLKEFDELVSISKMNHVYLIEMDRVTALPNFQIMKARLGELGKIRLVTIDFSQYSRKYDAYLSGEVSNVFTTKFSGGALYDLGVYCVNLVVLLFGKPANLLYIADKLETGVDVSGNLVLKYPHTVVSITVSKNSIGDKKTTIQGEKGSYISDNVPSVLPHVELVTRTGTQTISVEQPYNGTTYTLMEMKRIIDDRDTAASNLRLIQSRKVLQVLTSARKSAG